MEQKNQKSASKRIRFALWMASKNAGSPTDYRNIELTQDEATKLLEKYNEKTGYSNGRNYKHSAEFNEKEDKKSMYRKQFIEFFREKYLARAMATLTTVLGIESEVYSADAFGNDLGGKRYKMYGSGCAVAWLKFRKCEKYEMIYQEAMNAYNNECQDLIIEQIDKETIKRLETEGCPIKAILGQDYSFREIELDCIAEFLQKNGAKKIERHINYD